jgi:hypothetical protein
MLQFYADTGDSLRYYPNPAFYTGNIAVSQVSAAGVATFTAIGTPLVKGQQFYYQGTLFIIQANTVVADTTVAMLPRTGTAIVANQNCFVLTPVTTVNPGLGECNNIISKGSSFNPRDGYQALNGLVNQGRLARMQDTSFDASTLAGTYQTSTAAGQMFKNHGITNDPTTVVYNIFCGYSDVRSPRFFLTNCLLQEVFLLD